MQYHGIKGKQLELQDGNVVLKVQDDTTLGKQGAYISKDDGATFEKLVDVSDTARLCKFEPNRYYNENDMIVENNIIYTRKAAGISAATLGVDIANWEAQVHLHTSGNRYVKFKFNANSFTGPVSSSWRTLINYVYSEGDSSLLGSNCLVAPVDGLYSLSIHLGVFHSATCMSQIEVDLIRTDGTRSLIGYDNTYSTSNSGSVSLIRHFRAGEKLEVKFFTNGTISKYNSPDCEFGLIAEDRSDSLIAESTMVTFTSSAAKTWKNLAQENITNPSVIGTDGSITLPEDGMYIVNLTTGVSTSGGVNGRIQTRLVDANDNIIHFGSQTECYNTQIQGFTHLVSGKKGDIFYIKYYKDVAQSSLVWGNENQISKLSVAKLKSTEITLCSQDLYTEYLQNLPTGVTPMDYESWVKTIISQNQMRVKAKIVNQTRAASGVIPHKFTFAEGEQSMLSNNKFVAPFSGMYMINVPGLATTTAHSATDAGTTMITKGPYNLDSNLLGFSVANSTVTIPSVSTVCWLNKGEELSIWWNETAATSRTLLRNNYEAFVEFALIQSGHPYVNFPNLWTPDVEYDLGNGLYGKRVTGSVTASTKVQKDVSTTIDSGTASLIEYGGSWSPISTSTLKQSFTFSNIATAWAGVFVTNSANLTGITFRLYREDGGMSGINYDFWIKYTK